jgi:hypothetical protein
MKIIQKLVVYFLLVATFAYVTSCASDDAPTIMDYSTGVIVVNQGGFGSSNGTITWYHPTTGDLVEDVYHQANGQFAGDVLQSITYTQGQAFLVLNGSNAIKITREEDYSYQGTLTYPLLDKPRSLAIHGATGYVSVWGPYDEQYNLTDSRILKIDMTTLATIGNLPVPAGVDKLLTIGDRIFGAIPNFGADNRLVVIDGATGEIAETLTLADGPTGMVSDAQGKLWVLCNGTWNASTGKLFRLHPVSLEVEKEFDIVGRPGSQLTITGDGTTLVYRVGASIFTQDTEAETLGTSVFTVSGSPTITAIGVDPSTGHVLVGDAKDYSSRGEIFIYQIDGTPKGSFLAGIVPTEIHFR